MVKTKLRKGDQVMVISGRERGKTGKILSIDRNRGKVVVEKLNVIKRHTKPNPKVRQGGIIEREAPLPLSNVMYFSPSLQKPVRLSWKAESAGRKVRVVRTNNEVIE